MESLNKLLDLNVKQLVSTISSVYCLWHSFWVSTAIQFDLLALLYAIGHDEYRQIGANGFIRHPGSVWSRESRPTNTETQTSATCSNCFRTTIVSVWLMSGGCVGEASPCRIKRYSIQYQAANRRKLSNWKWPNFSNSCSHLSAHSRVTFKSNSYNFTDVFLLMSSTHNQLSQNHRFKIDLPKQKHWKREEKKNIPTHTHSLQQKGYHWCLH